MDEEMPLTKDCMWKAVISCNPLYDGLFFYGVKTTGIFCRPSCKSKSPSVNNILYFANINEAIKAGLRPCKRCRPDLAGKRYNPHSENVQQIKDMIENHYDQYLTLEKIASEVNISPFHLNRMFKNETGETPRSYLEKVRISNAKKMLASSSLTIAEAAHQVGFLSLSSFYKAFKKHEGITPGNFKMKQKG